MKDTLLFSAIKTLGVVAGAGAGVGIGLVLAALILGYSRTKILALIKAFLIILLLYINFLLEIVSTYFIFQVSAIVIILLIIIITKFMVIAIAITIIRLMNPNDNQGEVYLVTDGIVLISGMRNVAAGDMLIIQGKYNKILGMVYNLDQDFVIAVLLEGEEEIQVGALAYKKEKPWLKYGTYKKLLLFSICGLECILYYQSGLLCVLINMLLIVILIYRTILEKYGFLELENKLKLQQPIEQKIGNIFPILIRNIKIKLQIKWKFIKAILQNKISQKDVYIIIGIYALIGSVICILRKNIIILICQILGIKIIIPTVILFTLYYVCIDITYAAGKDWKLLLKIFDCRGTEIWTRYRQLLEDPTTLPDIREAIGRMRPGNPQEEEIS